MKLLHLRNYFQESIYFSSKITVYFRYCKKNKDKAEMLFVLPGFMLQMKKEIDMLTKNTISKISCRSKRFEKLASATDNCIAIFFKKNLKKLLVKTKIA